MSFISSLIEAVSLQQQGFPERAEAIYRSVLDDDPEQPNALYLYGLMHLKDGRTVRAATLLERAAAFRDDPEVWMNLARARLANGECEAALTAAEQALRRGGRRADALYIVGTAHNACGQPLQAAAALSEAAQIAPEHAAIRLNLGNAMADLDRLDEAKDHIEAAIALDPLLVEAHASLGYILAKMGQLQEAATACERALAIDPECGEAHWNLATALLLAGDFRRGFAEYEWRKRHVNYRDYFMDLPGPAWTGFPLDGLTVLVSAEQGLGDTIQFARFLPLLADAGAQVILAASPALILLLEQQPGLSSVVPKRDALPEYDCWVDQMSLPRLLGLTVDNIPGASGYLSADPERRRLWAQRIPDARIGLVWAGNPLHSNDRRRSLPLPEVHSLIIPGMVSLQTGPRSGEAAALGLHDLSDELANYAETAALVANLDLVITVDTSVAHLAGALGVPAWVMLPHAPDWRWIMGRDDTPWYDSIRLFRQSIPGDWAGVTHRIREALPKADRQAA